jgi:hypothetical protein
MRSGVSRAGWERGDWRVERFTAIEPLVLSGAQTDARSPTLDTGDVARAVLGESSRAAIVPSLRP